MQYYPGGNLQDLIDKDRKLTEEVARLYTAEMLLAVSHLHDRHIVYRDLKPANVVIDEFGHSALTDFGLSKEGVSQLRGTQSFCGSSAYMAPEILQRRGQGHTVDIYGLGVLLFNMLCGVPPFWHPDKKVLTRNIMQARLHTPDFVSEPAASLIKALMKREPSKRLGANRTLDVQEHEFFADTDFDEMMSREACVPAQAETSGPPTVWPSKEKCLFNWNNGKKSKCFS
jgi:serine/threonine protein kinase